MKVGGGRPGLPIPNKPTVSVDVKQHSTTEVQIESYPGIVMRPQWHDLIKSYQGHNGLKPRPMIIITQSAPSAAALCVCVGGGVCVCVCVFGVCACVCVWLVCVWEGV